MATMRAMQLRVIPAGCSRRTLLRGVAVAAASLAVGCDAPTNRIGVDAGSGSGGDDDAGTLAPDDAARAVATMCLGHNLCIDLRDPRNAALTQPGGALVVAAPADTIIVVRIDDATIQAVSDVCTHAACSVAYDAIRKDLMCPCHGSTFRTDGTVTHGPATRPLRKYPTLLDTAKTQVTIVLSAK